MNEKELLKLIKKGESETAEFKKSTAQMERALRATCAFLNHKGGVVYFGISDKNELLGQDVSDSTLKTISQKIRQKIKPEISPGIKVLEIENKKLIEVKIAKGTNKPYYLGGIAYKRAGSESPVIAPDELEKIILRKKKTYWDEEICEDATLDDIDERKIRWFLREAIHKRGLNIPENAKLKDALMQLKLMQDNKLTNAAILLFGNNPEQLFIQSEVKCIALPTTKFIKPYNTYQAYEGSLFEQVDKSVGFVLENIRRPLWVEPGEVAARHPYEIPREAVREAIVNAIVHRDYLSPSKVQVRVFPDRVEIWNPGQLPSQLKISDLKNPHPSIPCNPLLFRQFYRAVYVEDVGGGTVDIIGMCKGGGLPEPEFEQKMGNFVITLRRSILTDEYLSSLDLKERQKRAVAHIEKDGRITRAEYEIFYAVSERTSNRELNDLVNKKLLKKTGKGPETHYILARYGGIWRDKESRKYP